MIKFQAQQKGQTANNALSHPFFVGCSYDIIGDTKGSYRQS